MFLTLNYEKSKIFFFPLRENALFCFVTHHPEKIDWESNIQSLLLPFPYLFSTLPQGGYDKFDKLK